MILSLKILFWWKSTEMSLLVVLETVVFKSPISIENQNTILFLLTLHNENAFQPKNVHFCVCVTPKKIS